MESTPLWAPSKASGDGSTTKWYVWAGHFSHHQDRKETSANATSPSKVVPTLAPTQQTQQHHGPTKALPRNNNHHRHRHHHESSSPLPIELGTLKKRRRINGRIDPKVFFANERTFLAWMHLSVTLAGASIAILAFADNDGNPFSQLYGIIWLPVAIAFILHSMYQYAHRVAMLNSRDPGPYDDTTGPPMLGIMLLVSILAQFGLKLYSLASSSTTS